MDSERLRTTVRYVCQDPVENLRVRITIARLSAATRGKAPSPPPPPGAQDAAAADAPPERDAAEKPANVPFVVHPAVTRVFGWQEKVYSRSELAAAREALAGAGANRRHASTGPPGRTECLGSQQQPGTDPALMAAALQQGQGAAGSGGFLFTYVHTDDFAASAEALRSVTTAPSESRNHLARRLLQRRPCRRERAPSARVMYLMADLGGPHSAAGPGGERVLAALRAHADGSLEVRPGFTAPGQRYRFEDVHGGIYEYSLEVVSRADPPRLELRAARLGASLLGAGGGGCTGALQLQGRGRKGRGGPPDLGLPAAAVGPGALRLLLFGELVAGAGFDRDRLYLEWRLAFDPKIWTLVSPGGGRPFVTDEPGLVKGVTHVSRVVCYPRDPLTNAPPDWVAHWGHPLEVEWAAHTVPSPGDWPVLMLQVCSYDPWDRYTCEGYGWLQLGPEPGASTATVPTWKPMGTRRDQHAAYFIGGSPELENPLDAARKRPTVPPAELLAAAYSAATAASPGGEAAAASSDGAAGPRDAASLGRQRRAALGPAVLNRYGLLTQSSGSIKVRLHCLHQLGGGWEGAVAPAEAARASPSRQPQQWASPSPRGRARQLSLAVVLERARARLEDARAGGGEVAVREGVASAAPRVRRHPVDASVDEGATVHFSVAAVGGEPLAYRWLKDGRPLRVATADSADLILADVTGADAGKYACHVTNGDGEVTSDAAVLAVRRVMRLQRVTRDAEAAGAATGGSGAGPVAATLEARNMVPRTVVRGGAGLPYNARAGVLSLVQLGAAAGRFRGGSSGDAAAAAGGSPAPSIGEGDAEGASPLLPRFARLRSRPGSAFSTASAGGDAPASPPPPAPDAVTDEQVGGVASDEHSGLLSAAASTHTQQQQQQEEEEPSGIGVGGGLTAAAEAEGVAAAAGGGGSPQVGQQQPASVGTPSRLGSGAGARRPRVSDALGP